MNLTDRQKIYVEMNLAKGLTSKDIESIFSKEEIGEFTSNTELQKHISEQKVDLELKRLSEQRKRVAMRMMTSEGLESLMPAAIRSMTEVLAQSTHINYMAVLRMVMGGNSGYVKKYAENLADSDCPPEQMHGPGNGGLNPFKLNYNLDKSIDE